MISKKQTKSCISKNKDFPNSSEDLNIFIYIYTIYFSLFFHASVHRKRSAEKRSDLPRCALRLGPRAAEAEAAEGSATKRNRCKTTRNVKCEAMKQCVFRSSELSELGFHLVSVLFPSFYFLLFKHFNYFFYFSPIRKIQSFSPR